MGERASASGPRLRMASQGAIIPGIAGLVHDVRAPLAAIAGAIDALLDNPDASAEWAERFLTMIRRNLAWTNLLVDRLTSAERGAARPRQLVVVEDLLQEVIALLAPNVEARGQSVTVRSGRRATVVRAQRTELARILLNLLDNASKYGPEGDALGVVVRRQHDGVTVWVCDHGPGIPRRERRAIFQPFYRGRGTASVAGGVGLGLATVRAIVTAHGGSVGVTRAGAETRVWFHLPDCLASGTVTKAG